jgi:signal transduction histidine kinase/CheY-like chemotaxis protein
MISNHWRTRHEPSERDLRLLDLLARQAADIIERKQAEKQLFQLNAELERRVADRTRDLVYSQNRLRKLASDLSLTEERERRRVAGELHDYLAQLLVATRMKLSQARQSRQASKQSDLLNDVDHMLDQSLTYTRTLVAQLSPPVLHEFGLAAALKWLGEQMARHGLHVTTEIEGEPVPLSEEQAVLVFQSARELLFNVLKHAGTDRAALRLNSTGGEMALTVVDEGRGFDSSALKETAASDGKFGLFSIRERMESLGGRVDLVSGLSQGTRVTLSIPAFSMIDSLSAQSEPGHSQTLAMPVAKSRQAAGRLRIVLVDDHAMVRQGLRSVLESHHDVEVIAEAGDGLQAISLTESLRPDVVVMDLTLPHIDGVEATRKICQANPSTVVIGLSVHQSWQIEQAIKEAGAAAFLTKDCAAEQLYEAITSTTMARSS